jgi:regulator of RNase E activity RraA
MYDLLADRLELCYTGAVYDVMRNMGYPDQVLQNDIRPMLPKQKIAGKIFTIEGKIDNRLDKHTSLLKWCEMLSAVPSDSVLICQPNDHTLAHMGELSAETLSYKKVKDTLLMADVETVHTSKSLAYLFSVNITHQKILSLHGLYRHWVIRLRLAV